MISISRTILRWARNGKTSVSLDSAATPFMKSGFRNDQDMIAYSILTLVRKNSQASVASKETTASNQHKSLKSKQATKSKTKENVEKQFEDQIALKALQRTHLEGIPTHGAYGELVYVGSDIEKLEFENIRLLKLLIQPLIISNIMLKFFFGIPLLYQLLAIVPLQCIMYFGFIHKPVSMHKKYVLCLYYDQDSKLFTSLTWKHPTFSLVELNLQRFYLEDVQPPQNLKHNIVFNGRRRVIENNIDCFLNKDVYKLLENQIQRK